MMLALLMAISTPTLPGALEPAPLVALESPSETLFRQGRDFRYAQRWFDAAQAYRTLLRDFPSSPRAADARYWLASSLEQDQRWDDAIEAYTDFLTKHPDQRLLGKEARLNRVRCWGIRQWDSPTATAGLASALSDDREEVRVAAALQLAKRKDKRAVPVLQIGLRLDSSSEACRLALQSMGVEPKAAGPAQGRFLSLRVKERGKSETLTIRLALGLARAVGGYLSDEQLQQAKKKGIDLERLMDQALNAPKGTELFSLDDGKSTVTVTVE
ncbi:tetratricopeptide repeat protein [Geothrix sp. PMB-07]|uniref:tetratricopeptide repeat protein n=1 Tax=Geothrix sp. PMB-07 TaxID=3068640 RepID=UPI0027418C5C|nr:tetratricopeptide repeat protein [Geothrix sp. PMB-07]WLT31777.1 tetratricopeptide repeat protein [Geothrix sp. PMB-07]